MNEASNFCGGPCFSYQQVDNSLKKKLKYIPTNRDLEVQSLPLDAMHYGDISELDAHSIFGTQEVIVTHKWFKS